MNHIYILSEDFLEDVKTQIKIKYYNQSNYAKVIGYSRKSLNRILNSGDNLNIRMINLFCSNLNIKIEDYISRI